MPHYIADFSDVQVAAIQAVIDQRYGEETKLVLGDGEVQVDPSQSLTVSCPILFWSARACNFVIMRCGDDQYCAQFYYDPSELFTTHQAMFTVVEDCAIAVLREQSDHERESKGVKSGMTGADLS